MSKDDNQILAPSSPSPDDKVRRGDVLPPSDHGVAPALPALPAAPAVVPAPRVRSRWKTLGLLAIVILGACGGSAYWWHSRQGGLPLGIVSGNGRIEADEIDIDTKFAGRIIEMDADEGDMLKPQQVVARMDTRDLEATLEKSEAQVQGAQQSLDAAHAEVVQETTQVTLAQQQFDRTSTLVKQGFATNELLDERRQTLNGAGAALTAANDRVGEAARTLDAATHDVELYKVNIADNTLVAPRNGRIEYRVANIGEVMPAGGKVFTMLDIEYVYMDIYLPTDQAGKVEIGSDARIVLDALPAIAIPAKVAFVARQAQFTPKTVETKDERDLLMFRVRVKIDPERLREHAASVRSGLPGVGYVKYDPTLAWPTKLQGDVAP
ncbi:HlyD family secretion protein [Roseiarcus fermentans]|uniref:HlyD family secretion protein n=2 Tax=Roseiarcus fermentans TaxID=1473586 RepID=A0A366F711_9HYPH|nr:HlyD family efflux transporter periplasmic adaptor subunit [Roseiarcus fermentans]RBP10428.1 HlyD family secretion protein [Roseiarcus fermentans]